MRVGLYDPYLDTVGGGERYVLTAGEHWSKNHQVDIFWDKPEIKEELEKRLGVDLSGINFVPNIFNPLYGLLKRLFFLFKYDLLFFLSDGSIPFSSAKKTILHLQVPFTKTDNVNIIDRLKLSKIKKVVVNSYFTKRFIDQTYGVKSFVIYPPVDVENFKPGVKKNIILTVGRFISPPHHKKQEIMVGVFKKMYDGGLRNWQFFLVGGIEKEKKDYIKKLEKKTAGYPVKFLTNIDFKALQKIYGEAKIYWHATGFGEDLELHPQKAEHFGITTVEAMAAGCVPVVFSGGGQKEIVQSDMSGFLWETKEDLTRLTKKLIDDEKLREKLSSAAQERSKDFSGEKFYARLQEIIS